MKLAALLLLLIAQGIFAQERVVLDHDFSKDPPVIHDEGRTGHPLTSPINLPLKIQADRYYQLSLDARSTTRSPLLIKLHQDKRSTLWTSTIDLPEVWSSHNQTFQVNSTGDATLELTATDKGIIDLAHLTIIELSRDQLIAKMKADHQETLGENLLRVSTFTLGLPSGGAVNREISSEFYTIEGDEKTIGPSGGPALHVKSSQSLPIYLPPEDLHWTFTKHVASIYVRGNGSGAFHILADGEGVGGVGFNAKPNEWTRVSFAFDPRFMAREHQPLIVANGDLWFDAAKLELGDKPTPYSPRCEVSLGWQKSDASLARIYFDDEPPRILWRVVNAPKNAHIHAESYDIMGQVRDLPSMPLRGNSGLFQLPDRLGVFRVEAWVEDANGKRISNINEAIMTRVHRPRFWNVDAPQSHFGVHMGPVTQQMILSKAVGINWVRLHDAGTESVGWAFVEPEKGKWSWRDNEVARYRHNHISILGMLSQSPGWASRLDHAADYWEHYFEPADLNEYANYVRTITAHYNKDIRVWDVWNEPWNRFWTKYDPQTKRAYRSEHAGQEFAALEHSAYIAAKSVDSSLRIAGLNTTAGNRGKTWTDEVTKGNGLDFCDFYDYHHYTNELCGYDGDVVDRTFRDIFDPIRAAKGKIDKPIWMTEGNGTNTLISKGFYNLSAPGMLSENSADVAERLARYSVATLSHGVEKIFFYHINIAGEWHPSYAAFQTLVTDDCFPHPCAAAIAQLAWEIDELKFAKRTELTTGVFAYDFAGPNRSVTVLSSAPSYQHNYPVPANSYDMMGNKLATNRVWDGHLIYIHR